MASSAEHNAADLSFAQQMTVHHQGAVEMADLAPSRAANQQVKDLAINNPAAVALAESIKTSQTAEITQMQQLLSTL